MSATVGMPPVLFLVLLVGNAGRADVGGPIDGRADRGNDVAIAALIYIYMGEACSKLCVRLYRGVFSMKRRVSARAIRDAANTMRCERLWSSNTWLCCKR